MGKSVRHQGDLPFRPAQRADSAGEYHNPTQWRWNDTTPQQSPPDFLKSTCPITGTAPHESGGVASAQPPANGCDPSGIGQEVPIREHWRKFAVSLPEPLPSASKIRVQNENPLKRIGISLIQAR
jgi:hypothetical protein